MQNIATKGTGDSLTAAEWNQVPDELENAITDSGQVLSGADLYQVSKSMATYAAGGAYYTDSGAADAYVLSTVGSKRAPTAYFDGMEIEFIAGNPNTGASTVNVAALGVVDIKTVAGAALPADAIQATTITKAVYNAAAGDFFLTSSADNTTYDDSADPFTGTTVQAMIANLASYSTSLAASGYTVLPNGLVLQWGTTTITETTGTGIYYTGTKAITFPMTFPNNAYLCVATAVNTPNALDSVATASLATTGVTLVGTTSNESTQTATVLWFALGD